MIPIYVGFDQREACVFHVFNQSLIEHATQPVSIHPLSKRMLHFDGHQWEDQGPVSDQVLDCVWGFGPDDIYAVGAVGSIVFGWTTALIVAASHLSPGIPTLPVVVCGH